LRVFAKRAPIVEILCQTSSPKRLWRFLKRVAGVHIQTVHKVRTNRALEWFIPARRPLQVMPRATRLRFKGLLTGDTISETHLADNSLICNSGQVAKKDSYLTRKQQQGRLDIINRRRLEWSAGRGRRGSFTQAPPPDVGDCRNRSKGCTTFRSIWCLHNSGGVLRFPPRHQATASEYSGPASSLTLTC
jgi:hypothetical protein